MLDAGPFLTGNSNADPELNTTGSFLCECIRRDSRLWLLGTAVPTLHRR